MSLSCNNLHVLHINHLVKFMVMVWLLNLYQPLYLSHLNEWMKFNDVKAVLNV